MRCVIVGAAEIKNYKKIKEFLNPDDFYIFCDGGLNHQKELGVIPNLIIGDFDSYDFSTVNFTAETIRLPCEKDDTDVFFAVKTALSRGYKDFILLGVIGQRFDHSLCNISVLMYLRNAHATGLIIDDYSTMQIIGNTDEPVPVPSSYSYFSIMCIDGAISGVTIKNAKYPLENAKIDTSYQFGISNEVSGNEPALVTIKNGLALLIGVF